MTFNMLYKFIRYTSCFYSTANLSSSSFLFSVLNHTWKLWMGLGVGSQVERGFSCERKGPLKAWVMALRLKAQTADAAMLLLYREGNRGYNIFLILIPRTFQR